MSIKVEFEDHEDYQELAEFFINEDGSEVKLIYLAEAADTDLNSSKPEHAETTAPSGKVDSKPKVSTGPPKAKLVWGIQAAATPKRADELMGEPEGKRTHTYCVKGHDGYPAVIRPYSGSFDEFLDMGRFTEPSPEVGDKSFVRATCFGTPLKTFDRVPVGYKKRVRLAFRNEPSIKPEASVSFLWLDVENTTVSFDAVADALAGYAFDAVMYTTASNMVLGDNGKSKGPRYRVIVPLAKPIDVADLANATYGLMLLCGLTESSLDPCCLKPIQVAYLPARVVVDGKVQGTAEPTYIESSGSHLYADSLILAGAKVAAAKVKANAERALGYASTANPEQLAEEREALLYRALSEKFPNQVSKGKDGQGRDCLICPCPWEEHHSNEGKEPIHVYWTEGENGYGGVHCHHTTHGEGLPDGEALGELEFHELRKIINISLDEWKAATVGVEADDISRGKAVLLELIKNYVWVKNGNHAQPLHTPHEKSSLTLEALRNEFYGAVVPMGESETISAVNYWMGSEARKGAEALGYDPQEKRIYRDENGMRRLNTFTFPSHSKQVNEEHWEVFKKHIAYLYPGTCTDERKGKVMQLSDYILSWLAHIVQHPEERPAVVPLSIAHHQGTGRSMLNSWLLNILGWHNCSTATMDQLTGKVDQFTAPLHNTLLCVSPEVVNTGSVRDKVELSAAMRDRLTEKIIGHRGMRKDLVLERCYTRALLATNHGNAIIPEKGDRRILLCAMRDEPKGDGYYKRLHALAEGEHKNAAAASVFHKLMEHPLDKFDPSSHAPMTDIKSSLTAAAVPFNRQVIDMVLERLEKLDYPLIAQKQLVALCVLVGRAELEYEGSTAAYEAALSDLSILSHTWDGGGGKTNRLNTPHSFADAEGTVRKRKAMTKVWDLTQERKQSIPRKQALKEVAIVEEQLEELATLLQGRGYS